MEAPEGEIDLEDDSWADEAAKPAEAPASSALGGFEAVLRTNPELASRLATAEQYVTAHPLPDGTVVFLLGPPHLCEARATIQYDLDGQGYRVRTDDGIEEWVKYSDVRVSILATMNTLDGGPAARNSVSDGVRGLPKG